MSHPLWSDEYWLLLMQLYQRKPAGIKPLYSRGMVELSLELHIPPHYLYEQMFSLRRAATPRLGRLWATYGDNPRRLSRDVKVLRSMAGFSNAALFYDGVAMHESFERDFRPMPSCGQLMPMMLILKSATTRLYDTEAKIICIVSKKGAQCIECHHKDI